jgi:hypothetical protein
MMMRMSLTILLLSAAACSSATGGGGGNDPFGSGDRPDFVVVEVDNLNFSDARLYVIRDGQRLSLGTVGGKQTDSFRVDWRLNQDMRIEINLLAGPTCTTDRLQVQQGDILELQIPSVFSSMSACR